MKKGTTKKQTTASKESSAKAGHKLSIISRHAVGVDTTSSTGPLSSIATSGKSISRFTVVPVFKKRLTKKHGKSSK